MTVQWVPRLTIQSPVEVTPTISTSAYTAGDQVGGVMTLTNVVRNDPNTSVSGDRGTPTTSGAGLGTATLTEITVLDKAGQNAAFEVWFFKSSPTITSVDNGAFNLTDANSFAACIGHVNVGATYSTSSSNSVSTTSNLNKSIFAASGSTIYAVAKTTGTPTYGSTSDLKFIFNFLVD